MGIFLAAQCCEHLNRALVIEREAAEKYMLEEVCGGGLLLGAIFMATDYVTSPITPNGKIVFGCCLGLLTFIFRMYGGSAEGVSYAIIFCNLLVPLIERVTVPKSFGKKKPEKKAKEAA